MVKRCWNLRTKRAFRQLREAFCGALGRFGVCISQYSVQGNHIHLIVEAIDHVALGRAMKGLGVRIARKLNRLMDTKGAVLGDRYFARPLRTGSEVHAALQYVLNNRRRHCAQFGKPMSKTWIDPFSTGPVFPDWADVGDRQRKRVRDPCPDLPLGILPARTLLLRFEWKRRGLLVLDFVPGKTTDAVGR